jgi:hypothetical protein
MKRDPALDPFRDLDDFRLLMIDRTSPTKPVARASGRLELAHRTRPTDGGDRPGSGAHHSSESRNTIDPSITLRWNNTKKKTVSRIWFGRPKK